MRIAETVARNIRRYRKKRQLTQVELAGRLGVQQGYVSTLENAGRVPSLDMLEKVAKALWVAPWRLLK